MSDFTEQDIIARAYQIYKERKRTGQSGSQFSDYMLAKDEFKRKELENNITRGECGQ